MIRMQEIGKSYQSRTGRETEALKEVNLHIPPGAYAAFVGKSGSGKSTLMNILGCLDNASTGRYWLDGMDVSSLDEAGLCELRKEKIGFVFQGYQLLRKLTALENAAFPLMIRGMEERRRLERAAQALESVGLKGRENHLPSELSGGQQQRVALARALITRPRLLLCDEPTGALDEESRNGILDLLDELHGAGHTIVLITHDRQVALRARTRYLVSDGCVTPCEGGEAGL